MAGPEDFFESESDRRMAAAVVSGDVATTRALLQSGQVDLQAMGREQQGWVALAIQAGQRAVFDILLQAGAVADPRAAHIGQALYHATVVDDPSWLRALVAAGADLNNFGGGELLLRTAADTKLPARLDFYIENGADLDALTNMRQPAVVSLAASGNYPALITLLEAGASPWATAPNGASIGFWLERTSRNPAWDAGSEAEQQRLQIISMLEAAGVPYPPPAPVEVKRRLHEGEWPPAAQ